MKSLDPAGPEAAEAVPGLIALLRDVDASWSTRRQAALTLGRIGRPARRAVPILVDLLDEPAEPGSASSGGQRLWVAKALALFGPDARAAVPELIRLLKAPKQAKLHRLAMIAPLARIGPAHPDAVPALIDVLQWKSGRTAGLNPNEVAPFRHKAADALGAIGAPAAVAVPALTRAARDEDERLRLKAAAALGAMGPRGEIAVPVLAELLVFDESAAVRDAAGTALAQIGPAALEVFTKLLQSDDAELRRRAADGLAQMGPPAEPALDRLTDALQDDVPGVRLAAAEAVWKITRRPEAAVPVLVDMLTVADRQLRMRAVRLLEGMGPKARTAIPSLEKLRRHDRSYVRRAARAALERIESAPRSPND